MASKPSVSVTRNAILASRNAVTQYTRIRDRLLTKHNDVTRHTSNSCNSYNTYTHMISSLLLRPPPPSFLMIHHTPLVKTALRQ